MADKDLAALQVRLELQTAAFERGVKRMDKQLKKIEENTKRSSKQMNNLAKTLKFAGKAAAAFAGAAAAAFSVDQIKSAIEYGDAIAKTADKIGVTTDELQELRFAAGQSGVDSKTLDMALQRFARRMGEAAQGTGELSKTAKELGITFQDAEGRYYSTSELLEQYADAIGQAGTQQEKLRLAFKAFDSEGAALVNLLADGSEEMLKLRQQAVELGLVLDEKLARQSEVINDKFEILSQQIKTGISAGFIEATAAALEFFDVFSETGAAERRLAEVDAQIDALRDKLAEGRYRGSATDAQQLQQLLDKQAEIQAQLDALREAEKKRTEEGQAGAEGMNNALTRQAEIYKGMLDPLIPLGEEIEKIQSTVGNGLEQSEAWILIARAVAKYNEQAKQAVENSDDVKENFDDFLDGINQDLRAAAENPPLPKDWLADIGVGFGDVEEEADDSFQQILNAIDGFTTDFTNTLVDGLMEGELAFDDFAKSVLATITKMMLNKVFTQFFDLVLNSIPGFGGGTGSSGANPQAGPSAAPDARTRMGDEVMQPMLSSSQRGGMPALSSNSPVTVNVINNGRDDVEVQERKTSRGVEIDVLINRAVNKGIARGDFDNSMRAAYGSRRMAY